MFGSIITEVNLNCQRFTGENMITQKRVWELMSGACKYREDTVHGYGYEFECTYYGRPAGIPMRYCKCETCPILGLLVGQEIYKQ